MRLRFLGTRGEIERRSRLHRMHSSLLVLDRGHSLLIDYSLDWLGRRIDFEPEALLLTHAHADHAGGLRRGARWPAYAGDEQVIQAEVAALGRERGVRAEIAHDGMEVAVP